MITSEPGSDRDREQLKKPPNFDCYFTAESVSKVSIFSEWPQLALRFSVLCGSWINDVSADLKHCLLKCMIRVPRGSEKLGDVGSHFDPHVKGQSMKLLTKAYKYYEMANHDNSTGYDKSVVENITDFFSFSA